MKLESEPNNNDNVIVNLPSNNHYTSKKLEEEFPFKKLQSENVLRNMGNYIKKYYKPSGQCGKDYFFARFPFFLWITQYEFKSSFIKDLASGITVSLMITLFNSLIFF